MADLEALKDRVDTVVEDWSEALVEVSRNIHARPELGFEEQYAHDALSDLLQSAGLSVTRGAHGLPTAFVATAGTTGPLIAVLCEYDALPGLGHACGHNIIGAAGAGAAIAAAAVADEVGGRILALGTPAEEGGGGKVFLAEAGAFDDVDAALMIHPAGLELSRFAAIAIQEVTARYHGRAAHAAAAPEQGRNALDAAILGYQGVAALRQHIASDERVHGIVTDGGAAPNVVPDTAETRWYVRSPSVDGLRILKERVVACLEAGAAAAGCTVDIAWKHPAFANMVDNEPLLDRYRRNLARTGRIAREPDGASQVVGSTDMGNISHIVPSIHPMIAVSPPTVTIHTEEFARYAAAPEGDQAVLDGARAMAATVVDLWADDTALAEVSAALAAARAEGRATGDAVVR